ncbi:hypothetical protein OROGR_027582 [Orobanche gracilis]
MAPKLEKPTWMVAREIGESVPTFDHDMMDRLINIYSLVGCFPHAYHIGGIRCPTHQYLDVAPNNNEESPQGSRYARMQQYASRTEFAGLKTVSAVDFDMTGKHLASVTRGGCLLVHDFEALNYRMQAQPFMMVDLENNERRNMLRDEEIRHNLHVEVARGLVAVKWNPFHQNQVACVSLLDNIVRVFDVNHSLSEPASEYTSQRGGGLSDIAFTSTGSQIFASHRNGLVQGWDAGRHQPCINLLGGLSLKSVELDGQDQVVFAAGRGDGLYMWDVRAGTSSAASPRQVNSLPSVDLFNKLKTKRREEFKSNAEELVSVRLNPSCKHLLAFQHKEGWSGTFNLNNLNIAHIHRRDSSAAGTGLDWIRPSWFSTKSIYLEPLNGGIRLVDFHPTTILQSYEADSQDSQSRDILLPQAVTSCANAPFSEAIVAGTKGGCLLVFSQKQEVLEGSRCLIIQC